MWNCTELDQSSSLFSVVTRKGTQCALYSSKTLPWTLVPSLLERNSWIGNNDKKGQLKWWRRWYGSGVKMSGLEGALGPRRECLRGGSLASHATWKAAAEVKGMCWPLAGSSPRDGLQAMRQPGTPTIISIARRLGARVLGVKRDWILATPSSRSAPSSQE